MSGSSVNSGNKKGEPGGGGGGVVSLLSDQVTQPGGTVDVLGDSFSETRPGAAETAASSMGSGVSESHGKWGINSIPSSSLWDSRLLKGSCRFAPPQSASVFLFFCLRLRLPPSSSAYVFAHFCFRLPRSSCSSVIVCLCGSATVVYMLTVCSVFHGVRVKAFVVLCFPMTNLEEFWSRISTY